jgi:N-acetyl-anhydromuramyl-L-alanine amidase AmpD
MPLIDRTLNAYWPRTKHRIVPVFIVLHHTGQLSDGSRYLMKNEREVSAHYHIARDGKVTEFGNLASVAQKWACLAYHAGKSTYIYKGQRYNNLNDCSVGIEMDGDGRLEFTDIQYEKVTDLVHALMTAFDIPPECIVGHKEIAPGRKPDPAPFDMAKFRKMIADERASNPYEELRPDFKLLFTTRFSQITEAERNGDPVLAALNRIMRKLNLL